MDLPEHPWHLAAVWLILAQPFRRGRVVFAACTAFILVLDVLIYLLPRPSVGRNLVGFAWLGGQATLVFRARYRCVYCGGETNQGPKVCDGWLWPAHCGDCIDRAEGVEIGRR